MTALSAAALEGGFADAAFDSQAIFRAAMAAFARPGRPVACLPRADAPRPMTPLLASLALTLVDPDTPVWLDAALAGRADVRAWLAFHTGAPMVDDPAEAAFAFVADPRRMPALSAFAQGTQEYPDRSTTVIVAVDGFLDAGMTFRGPGIEDVIAFEPVPAVPHLAARIAANRQLFPRGVDLLFAAADRLAALPRSVRLIGS